MFKSKNICLIISVIIAIIWMIVGISAMCDVSSSLESGNTGEEIGIAIGMALLMPYLIVASIGTILHLIGGCTYKRGLVLAGLICECASLLLGITWGFGYIVAIIFGFIGYSQMKKI